MTGRRDDPRPVRTCDDCGTPLHWMGAWLKCGCCGRPVFDTSRMAGSTKRYLDDLKRSKQS